MTSNWRTKESLLICGATEVTHEVLNAHYLTPSIANLLFSPMSGHPFELQKALSFCLGSAGCVAFLSGQFPIELLPRAVGRTPTSATWRSTKSVLDVVLFSVFDLQKQPLSRRLAKLRLRLATRQESAATQPILVTHARIAYCFRFSMVLPDASFRQRMKLQEGGCGVTGAPCDFPSGRPLGDAEQQADH